MLNKSGRYYIWRTQFNIMEQKTLLAIFTRTVIEYSSYFILLSHHHALAMLIFQTKNWYPATLYFEFIFCITIFTSFLVTYFFLAKSFAIERYTWLVKLSFFAQLSYLGFYAIGLDWLNTYFSNLVMPAFLLVSIIYIVFNGCEKFITLNSLLGITTARLKYTFVTEIFLFAVTLGLFIASFCLKAAVIGSKYHVDEMTVLILPLLLAGVFNGIYDCYFLPDRIRVWRQSTTLKPLMPVIRLHSQKIVARVLVNLMIGVFLVKWYFNIPFLLQYSEKWNPDAIANIVLLCGIISISGGIVFRRIFERVDIHRLFAYVLLTYIMFVMLININLYYHHWITLSVLLMALFYNFLNGIINRIVHYNCFDYTINTLLLVIGSMFGIVVFSFLSSSLSIFFAKQVGISSQPIVNMLVMLGMIIIGWYGFFKMKQNN